MKKNNKMKKILTLALSLAMVFTLTACGGENGSQTSGSRSNVGGASGSAQMPEPGTVFKVGICNYMNDASLNQINENIQARLGELGAKNGVTFTVYYENPEADPAVMNQIISNFQADKVDLMVGIATPVAVAMQAATEDTDIPVVFSAVSDPMAENVALVDSLEHPGGNITGTSDYLDTNSIMNLIFAVNPDVKKIGFLYDVGQDSSATPIAHAKEYLDAKGIAYVERTGTNATEVAQAAQALVADGVDAVFTPTDNTIMKSYLGVYETFVDAGIPHYTGADSFALNGAFLGYGVDYANLGRETADMIFDILYNGASPASTPVKTFDNDTATINTETCAALNLNYDEIAQLFTSQNLCTKVQPITTAEEFGDLEG
ncbi:ABC transporter substrate-binding protein [Oscillospiraceae bacterium 44-34]